MAVNPSSSIRRKAGLAITREGVIANPFGPIGRIQVVQFNNEQRLQKVANSYYSSEDPPEPFESAQVMQGMIEKSNVQPIVEMTRMIQVMRSYTATKNMLDSQHRLQRSAIERLARIRIT